MHSFLFFFNLSPTLFQRFKLISRIIFLPCLLWFLIFASATLGKDLMFVTNYFDSTSSALFATGFIVFGLIFLTLEVQLVIEDYISTIKVRNVFLGILHLVSILGIYIGVFSVG